VLRRRAHRGVETLQGLEVLLDAGDDALAAALGIVQAIVTAQPVLVGLLEIEHEGFLVGLRVVDHAAQLVQAALAQAVEDDVDRGPFLADEEHPLAAPDMVGDQVGDGLRLAGAGRALNDVALATARQGHCSALRGIGLHHGPLIGQGQRRRRLGVDLARQHREHAVERRVDHVGIDQRVVVAHQRHLAVVEVAQRDAAEIQIPEVGVGAALAQREGGGLGFVRGHLRVAWRRCTAHRLAQGQRRRAHALVEQLEPERAEVVGAVAVVGDGRRHRRAHTLAAAKLFEPLTCPLVDQLDLGLRHQAQLHAGLGGRDLRLKLRMKVRDGGGAQIHRFGQRDAIDLAQLLPQHRIDFGLGGVGLQQVLIAHAFLACQIDRQQQQRRDDALVAVFLQVVPAQEGDHQRELREAVLGAVTARFLDDAVKRARQVGLVFEAQPARQRHPLAAQHVGGE
jgi:hypothetical protein